MTLEVPFKLHIQGFTRQEKGKKVSVVNAAVGGSFVLFLPFLPSLWS